MKAEYIAILCIVIVLIAMVVREVNSRKHLRILRLSTEERQRSRLFSDLKERLGLVLAGNHTPQADERWKWTRLEYGDLTLDQREFWIQKMRFELENPLKNPGARLVKENEASKALLASVKQRRAEHTVYRVNLQKRMGRVVPPQNM